MYILLTFVTLQQDLKFCQIGSSVTTYVWVNVKIQHSIFCLSKSSNPFKQIKYKDWKFCHDIYMGEC